MIKKMHKIRPLLSPQVWLLCCGSCFFFFLFSPASVWSNSENPYQSREKLLIEVEEKNHFFLKDLYVDNPENNDALWRYAYSTIRQGWLSSDSSQRKQHYLEALDLAYKAYEKLPDNYDSHLLLGAAKAKAIGYFSKTEQVKLVKELGQHARYLLEQRDDDPDVWYIYAWWHFRLSDVGKTERLLALFLGGLPSDCSYDNAFAAMEKAIQLKPDYAVYLYDLGLFHDRTGNTTEAHRFYTKALQVFPSTPEDYIYMRRAQKKLASTSEKKDSMHSSN